MKKRIGSALDKVGLKKHGLKTYFFLKNNWDNFISKSRKKIIPLLVSVRSGGKVYAIDIDSGWLGLGARIVKTIEILLFCQERNMIPLIRYNYREKVNRGNDYFSELFHYKLSDKYITGSRKYTKIRDVDELGWPEIYNQKLKLSTAKLIFDQYLGINQEILLEVDQFFEQYLKNKKVLGLHYRGTDKSGEAPLIPNDQLLIQIHSVLYINSELDCIFISSDDMKMIEFLKQSALPIPIFYRDDAIRSVDGHQFHRKIDSPKSIVNRDAIVNMLLLSKCTYLLKTASILSDCSVIFNPSIKVKLISRPHSDSLTWWPCSEIIQTQNRSEKLYS